MTAVLAVVALSAAGWASVGWLSPLAFALSQVPAAVVLGALLWHVADRVPWDARPIRSYKPVPVVEPLAGAEVEVAATDPIRLDDYRARKAA